ncbi:hypothetical protein CDAR_411041 [Caerostris darwini]|uniref:Uncharacterized protein n=1 Tax=Caerostris darwini TaxID=1538125 RepID=A0AAV4SCW1_9ARAC|nr:hypothetical protein CDAR_411041 [Caerostris darwini]
MCLFSSTEEAQDRQQSRFLYRGAFCGKGGLGVVSHGVGHPAKRGSLKETRLMIRDVQGSIPQATGFDMQWALSPPVPPPTHKKSNTASSYLPNLLRLLISRH